MTILVTDRAGSIGVNFVLDWRAHADEPVVSLDKLTCAGNLQNQASLDGGQRYAFVHGDIGNSVLLERMRRRDSRSGEAITLLGTVPTH
jgi:dTDP-glucose 4,6-dehydratase